MIIKSKSEVINKYYEEFIQISLLSIQIDKFQSRLHPPSKILLQHGLAHDIVLLDI